MDKVNVPLWDNEELKTFIPCASSIGKMKEISTLLNSIKTPTQTKLVFQTLPKHMRRRTMSYNPKRLPRKFRIAHTSQMKKSGIPKKDKRPSRKFRRKPSNLMKEYIRRQMKNIWLETHIWHAKRFHMTSSWGYKIPLSPCDKRFRCNYRATTKHCLIQDISYMGCIEISGPIDEIKNRFQEITSPKCGLSLTAKIYVEGQREGHLELFKVSAYPNKAIGRVSFMWKPPGKDTDTRRTVWIFAHPSFYTELMNELTNLFKLKKIMDKNDVNSDIDEHDDEQKIKVDDNEDQKSNDNENLTKKEKTRLQFVTKNYIHLRTPKYKNNKTQITVTELKDTMNRFRLTGPLSQAVLSKAFKCKNFNVETEKKNWFHQFMLNNADAHKNQSEFWNNIKDIHSPAELSPNMILGLNIEDPRTNRPSKRTKALPDNKPEYKFNENVMIIPFQGNKSLIWNSDERNKLLHSMMSTQKYCELRNNECLVPGEKCNFEDDIQPVPVLLIQRPGSQNPKYKKLGYGSGWDVIIPSGYGISTWICLIMWGARAGGLRETKSIYRESGLDEFLPDTPSASKESIIKYEQLKQQYFRKPQNKRLNYTKFSLASPFKCPWTKLVSEWSSLQDTENNFFVLRDIELLQKLEVLIMKKENTKVLKLPANCLIPIYVKMLTRGNIGDFSIICIPKINDLKKNTKNKRHLEHESVHKEPLRLDPNETARKIKRREHVKLLKRLRNIRIRRKRKQQETSERVVRISKPDNEKIIAEQYKNMCELWLPENPKTIRQQCSREVFGYLTQSDFSFIESKGAGIGYITSKGLENLCKICKKSNLMILVRGTSTREYRMATFNIRTF